MDKVATIQAVINTLNIITVSGEQNLNRLLGSIQVLTQLKADIEKQEARTSHENNAEH